MNNLSANYQKILQTIRPFAKKINFPRQNRKPKLKNIELIALNLTAEYMSIDSENQLFRILPQKLSQRITRTVYNRRKRGLFHQIENLRQKLAKAFNEFEDTYIVDSMPLPVAKIARAKRSTICQENEETAPNMGYCPSQKVNYYGYKLHAVCSIRGIVSHFDLTKASVHDVNYLKDVKHNCKNCTIIADKGYIGDDYKQDLLKTSNICLEVPLLELTVSWNLTEHHVWTTDSKKIGQWKLILLLLLCDMTISLYFNFLFVV